MSYVIKQIGCKFFVEAQYVEYVAYRLGEHFFEAHFDSQGNIVSLRFRAEKMHAQLDMLKEIAPFVREGSYIEMQGEDYKRWRWFFCNGTCCKACAIYVAPKIRKKPNAAAHQSFSIN